MGSVELYVYGECNDSSTGEWNYVEQSQYLLRLKYALIFSERTASCSKVSGLRVCASFCFSCRCGSSIRSSGIRHFVVTAHLVPVLSRQHVGRIFDGLTWAVRPLEMKRLLFLEITGTRYSVT